MGCRRTIGRAADLDWLVLHGCCVVPCNPDSLVFGGLSDAEKLNIWIQSAVGLVLILVNVLACLLPVRAALHRTQADARRRLDAHA